MASNGHVYICGNSIVNYVTYIKILLVEESAVNYQFSYVTFDEVIKTKWIHESRSEVLGISRNYLALFSTQFTLFMQFDLDREI